MEGIYKTGFPKWHRKNIYKHLNNLSFTWTSVHLSIGKDLERKEKEIIAAATFHTAKTAPIKSLIYFN